MPEGPKEWSPRMYLAVKVNAMNDRNGNPRRGWAAINSRSGDMVDFVDEGYEGVSRLRRAYPHAVEGPQFIVTPREYRELKKFGNQVKVRKPELGKGKTMAKRSVPPVLMAWVHCRKESGVKPGVKMSARQKIDARACVVRQMRKKMGGK